MTLEEELTRLLALTAVMTAAVGAFDRALGQRFAQWLALRGVLASPTWKPTIDAAKVVLGDAFVAAALACEGSALSDVLRSLEALAHRGRAADPLLDDRITLGQQALTRRASTFRWLVGAAVGAALGVAIGRMRGDAFVGVWAAAGVLAMPGAESLRAALSELAKLLPKPGPITILPVAPTDAGTGTSRALGTNGAADRIEVLTQFERNWAGRTIEPRAVASKSARTRSDVVDGVREAAARGAPIRAIAGTFSDVSALGTRGMQLQVGGLRLASGEWVREVDRGRLDPACTKNRLVEVSAGARVHDVLEALALRDWALPMVGAFSGQTFIGAMSTGTHGARFPPLAAFVHSIELVTVGADRRPKLLRVERPSDAVISRASASAEGAPLARDKDWFEAAVISAGGVGVITSVIVEAGSEFTLVETRAPTTWGAVKSNLDAETFDPSVYARSFLLNPYDGASADAIACVVSVLEKDVPPDGAVGKAGGAPPHAADSGQVIDVAMARKEDIGPNLRNHAMDGPPSGKSRKYVNDSWRLLTGPARLPPGISIEYAFDPANAAAAVTDMLNHLIAGYPNDVCVVGPISIRGVGQFDAPLSPSDGGRRIAVEVLAALGSSTVALHHGDRALRELTDIALRHGGRVHWGQLRPAQLASATRQFPRYAAWRRACGDLDPLELFRNDFPR